MNGKRVVVVGAGPAGLAAAMAAARAGADVLVLEEQLEPGGRLLYQAQAVEGTLGKRAERPEALTRRLVEEARSLGAELRTGTTVAGSFPGNEVLVIERDQSQRLSADAIVVTTGSTDLPYPFPGATLPGVFSCRALQILLNKWRVRPGKRFAIVGTGSAADELAVDVLLPGGEVAWSGLAPAPFMRAEGENGVTGLIVGSEHFLVDVIAIAVGRQADAALAIMGGAQAGFSAALGGFIPLVNDHLQTTIPRLFVAGDAAGAGSVAVAIAEGRLAGAAAAATLGLDTRGEVETAKELGGDELTLRAAERSALQPVHMQPYE